MEVTQGRKFEKPTPGMYLATAVDLVEMPNVQTQYGIKNKVRIHWVLAHLNGQLYIGKDGSPVEAVGIWAANMGGKAELPKRLTQILGQAPPLVTSTEQLEQLVIGRSNILVLVQNPNPKDPNDPYINVDGIGPIQAGMTAPPIPANYVRFKNRPKTQAGPQGTTVATYATPAAAQAAQPNQTPATTDADTQQAQLVLLLAQLAASQGKTVDLNAGAPAAATTGPRPF
jgi:hypothetical protein